MRRIPVRLLALVVGLALSVAAAPVQAVQSTITVLLDLDNDQGTGCTISGFAGVEQRVVTTVQTTTGPNAATVTRIEGFDCASTQTFVDTTPHPVGIGNGALGLDVIETYWPTSLSTVSPLDVIHLGATNENANGGFDSLFTTDGTRLGGPILFGFGSIVEIPTLSQWGLLLLVLALAASAAVGLRRRPLRALLTVVLVLGLAGVAWAVVSDLDGGTTAEWNPASRLAFDGSATDDGAAIAALHAMRDDPTGRIYFRVDASLVFNTPPVVTTTPGATAFTEDGGPVVVDAGITVVDADSPNLASATVTIANPQDGAAETLAASACPGLVVTPGLDSLSITGSQPPATYQACLRSVTFDDSSQNPGTAARTLSFVANDGIVASLPASRTVTVAAVNDAPVVTTSGGVTAFTEDAGPVVVDSALTVTDVDNANLASATVAITNPQDGVAETLAASACPGLAVTAGLNSLSIAGSQSPATYQACLRSVAYDNASQDPDGTPRTIAFAVNDGTAGSAPANKTVTVTAVDDAPVVTTAVGATAFTEDGGPVVVDPGVTVTDADDPSLASATVTITNPQDGAAEVLAATTCVGITVTPGLNSLSLSGSATVAAYQTCFQSVTYDNTSQDPTPSPSRVVRFVANDGTASSNNGDKTVTVAATNDAPTDIALAPSSVAENQPIGTAVGSFTTTDPDAGDTHTYTLVGGAGSTDNASFSISGSQLLTAAVFDFETQASFSIRVRTTDSGTGSLFFEKVFTVTVTNANEAPTDLALAPSSVAENQPTNTVVGAFSSTDPDAGDTFTYTLVAGAGSADNGSFNVAGGNLRTSAVFDFETKSSYSIRVRTTDAGGLFFEKALTVAVTNVNEAPTDLALAPSSVAENQPINTVVGALSSTDPDAGDTFTYTLVAGAGSADNGSFNVAGGNLQTSAVFDFETKSSYSIRVRTTDAGGLFFEKALTVTVIDANDAPTDIALSPTAVAENQPSGTTVGGFSTTDQDAGDTHAYTLVAGAGSADNGSFSISGGQLLTAAAFDFETKSSYSIRVRSTDSGAGNLFFEKVFTVTVTDVNEAPTDLALSPSSVAENQPANTVVGSFSSADPDAGDSFTYTLVAGAGATDNASFTIVGGQLQTAAVFDFETQSSYSIRVRSTDSGALFFEKALTVTVTNVNEAPTDIGLSPAAVDENQSVNTVVGALSTVDPDSGDTFTYTLVAGAGSTDNASFNIAGGNLRTSAIFDFEAKSSYSIRVRSTDSGGLFTEKAFTVTIIDLPEPPIAAADSYDTVGNTELRVDLPAGTSPNVAVSTPASPPNKGVLDNDVDEDSGQTDTLVVDAITSPACGDTTPPFVCATTNGGAVTMESDGSFSYTPPAGNNADDSFTYRAKDVDGLTATAVVTLKLHERVWYVKNDANGGALHTGTGTSTDPFSTLSDGSGDGAANDAEDASAANDYLFVAFGDGITTHQAAGVALKAGQHLIGEYEGLVVTFSPAITFNGAAGTTSVTLLAQPGATACGGGPCRPLLDNPGAGGNAVSATDVVPAEVSGLDLAGNANGLDWTTNAAFSGGGTLTVRDDVVRGAGVEGIDLNIAGSGATVLSFHDNVLTASGNGLDLQETGTGALTITNFANNAVSGNTGGTGISVSGAIFDASPGNPINTVPGGTTVIGQSGNGTGTSGMVLAGVVGDLSFTDLDVFNDAGAGLSVSSSGALNAGAGTGFRITVGAGVATVDSNGGPAVSVNNASINLPLNFLRSTSSPTTGLSLVSAFGGVGGTALSVGNSGQIADPSPGASGNAVNIDGGSGNVTIGVPITNNSGHAIVVTNRTADTVTFSNTVNETGTGISLTNNGGATVSFTGAITASTGANPAFTATGGGTVTATATSSSISTSSGTAVSISGTTIGASGITFGSVSHNGNNTAISLNNTGSGARLRDRSTAPADDPEHRRCGRDHAEHHRRPGHAEEHDHPGHHRVHRRQRWRGYAQQRRRDPWANRERRPDAQQRHHPADQRQRHQRLRQWRSPDVHRLERSDAHELHVHEHQPIQHQPRRRKQRRCGLHPRHQGHGLGHRHLVLERRQRPETLVGYERNARRDHPVQQLHDAVQGDRYAQRRPIRNRYPAIRFAVVDRTHRGYDERDECGAREHVHQRRRSRLDRHHCRHRLDRRDEDLDRKEHLHRDRSLLAGCSRRKHSTTTSRRAACCCARGEQAISRRSSPPTSSIR